MSSESNVSQSVALAQEEAREVAASALSVVDKAAEQAGKAPERQNADNVNEAFAGLPMGLLIAQPFLEASKGQQALNEDYLKALDTLALQPDKNCDLKDRQTRVVEFNLNRPVQKADGAIGAQKVKVTAPMLSLVPIPALLIDDMSVSFETAAKAKAEAGFKGWGFNASVSGEVSSSASASRTSDTSAKYSISVHASQQPATEGMNKLASILASVIEPIPAEKSGS